MSSGVLEYFDEARRVLEQAEKLLSAGDIDENATARGRALAMLGVGYATLAVVERMRFDALRDELG